VLTAVAQPKAWMIIISSASRTRHVSRAWPVAWHSGSCPGTSSTQRRRWARNARG
jgi:hypothetical protein